MSKPHFKLKNDGLVYRMDAWANGVSGQGIAGMDKSQATGYSPSLFSRMDQFTLSNLYRNDWLSRKICQRPADDATRRFIELKGLSEEQKKQVMRRVDEIGLRRKVKQAIAWSRLYGGAGAIKIYDDRKDASAAATPGARLIDIIPIDRYGLSVNTSVTDSKSPYYGLPETYRARNGTIYHRTRIVDFHGADLTPDQRQENGGWGGSFVEIAYEAIKSMQGAMQDVNFLLQESGIGILSIPDLTMMNTMGGGITQAIMNRSNTFAQGKSIYRMGIIDAKEKFEFVNRSLQGIPDIIDRFMTVVAGATEMTELVLFGTSPSGLNASQEEQLQTYYDIVQTIQEGDPTRLINDVMESLSAEFGYPIEWDWCPLYQMTASQKADIMSKSAAAVAAITDQAALEPNDVKRALNATGVWQLEEDEELPPEELDDPLGLNAIGGGDAELS